MRLPGWCVDCRKPRPTVEVTTIGHVSLAQGGIAIGRCGCREETDEQLHDTIARHPAGRRGDPALPGRAQRPAQRNSERQGTPGAREDTDR